MGEISTNTQFFDLWFRRDVLNMQVPVFYLRISLLTFS
jgi:hypothetical protein